MGLPSLDSSCTCNHRAGGLSVSFPCSLWMCCGGSCACCDPSQLSPLLLYPLPITATPQPLQLPHPPIPLTMVHLLLFGDQCLTFIYICICGYIHVKARGQLLGDTSLLLPCGSPSLGMECRPSGVGGRFTISLSYGY